MQDGSAGSSPLALALEAHPVPSVWVDANGTPVWMNAAARALWASAVEASRTSRPVALEPLGLQAHRLAEPQAFSCDLQVPVAQGGSLQHRLAAAPASPQGRLVTLTPVQDLHQRAEQADRLSEHLAAAQEFGRLGVWERDIRSLAARWDDQAFALWGMDPATGMPVLSQIFERVIAEDRDDFEKALLDSMRHAGTYRHRLRVRHGDATLHHLHSQWMVLNGDDGLPQRAVGVIVDESEAWELARSHGATLTQLSAAVDVAQIALWRHDLQTRRLRLNAVAVNLLGLDPALQEYTDEALQAAVHPDDRDLVRQSARQALQQAEPVDFECRIRHADGSWRTVHTRRVVERDALGQPQALLGVSLDLTRQRDDARRAGEWLRRLDLTASAAGIGYWSLERGARRATWSPRMYVLHGLAPDAEVPEFRTWIERHVHPLDRERVVADYREWALSGAPTRELPLRLVRSDGTVVHLHTHSHAEGSGESALVFGIAIDVTARDAAEAALRHAAEQSALIARSVGLGTWTYDLASGEATWDEPMWQLRGLRPQEGPRIPRAHARRQRALARLALGAVRDADGTPVRRIGVNWDITDARTAEARAPRARAARRESQAKSQFLARMSHELRTPLNAVLGFTQLMLPTSPGRRQSRRCAAAAGAHPLGRQHLLALIDDVLDLSRLEGGEVRIAAAAGALRRWCRVLPLLRSPRRASAVCRRAGDLDFVLADATRCARCC
jgi:PAS domain S-box-containing protein